MEGSISGWLRRLQAGEGDEAARVLWERYFSRLVGLASHKLRGLPRRVADEEDLALSAFHSFFQAAAAGRLPQLTGRDNLWRILVAITIRKAIDRRRWEQRCKRAAVLAGGDSPTNEVLEQQPDDDPLADPAVAALMKEEYDRLIARLGDDQLRDIACLKLEGHTLEEIADKLQCGVRTVHRRLALIRKQWETEVEETAVEIDA